jgi:hypothetical protein
MQVGVEGSTAAANPRVFPNLPFLSFSLRSSSFFALCLDCLGSRQPGRTPGNRLRPIIIKALSQEKRRQTQQDCQQQQQQGRQHYSSMSTNNGMDASNSKDAKYVGKHQQQKGQGHEIFCFWFFS